jgi:hypothetical protein
MIKEFLQAIPALKLLIRIFAATIANLKHLVNHFSLNHPIKAEIPVIPGVILMRYGESRRNCFNCEKGDSYYSTCFSNLTSDNFTQNPTFLVCFVNGIGEVLSKISRQVETVSTLAVLPLFYL